MDNPKQIHRLGDVLALLSTTSRRPRYAFVVLQLITELADERGHAGPFVRSAGKIQLLREWLCEQLLPISEQTGRRAALRSRVEASLAGTLSGNHEDDELRIEQAVDDQVRAAGRANISRAVSDLVRAGIMDRHYQGYATNHCNQGGGRNVVYVVKRDVLLLLSKKESTAAAKSTAAVSQNITPAKQPWPSNKNLMQGDLFAL